MSLESEVFSALKALVGNRVYPAVAPEGTAAPYLTWQVSGGQAVNFMDGAQPSKKNSRIQLNVWSLSLAEALKLAQQAETILRARSTLSTTVETAQFTRYEPDTRLHGTYQFFSCWADISS